jgi:pimeloyl-ACP methyl ester carboxylesterase
MKAFPLRSGVFDSREYGIVSRDPMEQPALTDLDLEERQIALSSLGLESRLARDERKRGIVIGHLPCPLLIVTGELDTSWPRERYAGLPLLAEYVAVEACSHWGWCSIVVRFPVWCRLFRTGSRARCHRSS